MSLLTATKMRRREFALQNKSPALKKVMIKMMGKMTGSSGMRRSLEWKLVQSNLLVLTLYCSLQHGSVHSVGLTSDKTVCILSIVYFYFTIILETWILISMVFFIIFLKSDFFCCSSFEQLYFSCIFLLQSLLQTCAH